MSTMPHAIIAPAAAAAVMPATGADRREAERTATVFTIGRMVADGRDLPCMVRDISAGGMRVRLATPPPVGAAVMIEMRGLDVRPARVRWTAGRDAGVSFDTPCDLAAVFEARLRRTGQVARQPRFRVQLPVLLKVDDRSVSALVEDISVSGARFAPGAPLKVEESVLVALKLGHGADLIAATVRWVKEGACGVRFDRPMGSLALAMALEAAQG